VYFRAVVIEIMAVAGVTSRRPFFLPPTAMGDYSPLGGAGVDECLEVGQPYSNTPRANLDDLQLLPLVTPT
jgi:hypothetical protein